MVDFREIGRFLVTGVIATLGNMTVVWLLRGPCSLKLSLAVGFVTGMAVSFVMMKTFAFKAREWGGAKGELLRFLIVYAIGTGCYAVMALASEHYLVLVGVPERVAALGGVFAGGAVMAVTSYFGHRHFTYRRRSGVTGSNGSAAKSGRALGQ